MGCVTSPPVLCIGGGGNTVRDFISCTVAVALKSRLGCVTPRIPRGNTSRRLGRVTTAPLLAQRGGWERQPPPPSRTGVDREGVGWAA